jgi:hypothetical protein
MILFFHPQLYALVIESILFSNLLYNIRFFDGRRTL